MEREAMKQLVRDAMQALSDGDYSVAEQHPGLAATIPFMQMQAEIMTDTEVLHMQQLVDDDWVVTRVVSEHTQVKDFMGTPGNGQRIQTEGIMMHRIENGRIVEQRAQGGAYHGE